MRYLAASDIADVCHPFHQPLVPGMRRQRGEAALSNRHHPPSYESTVQVYEEESISRLTGHRMEVFICQWNPKNPHLVASGSGDSSARLWTLPVLPCGRESGRIASANASVCLHGDAMRIQDSTQTGDRSQTRDVTTLDWSSDGRRIATGSYDTIARIWDSNGSLQRELRCHTGPIFTLKWNKSSTLIATGSVDSTAIAWDPETGYCRSRFDVHCAPVLDLDWMDDEVFATCSTDKSICILKVGSPGAEMRMTGHSDEVNAIRWSPGNEFLGTCSDDKTAKLWKRTNAEALATFQEHEKEIYTIRWRPIQPVMLATASFDATIKFWDIERDCCRSTLMDHNEPVYSIAFSPNGKYLASGSFDKCLHIWDVETAKLVRSFRGPGSIFEVCWNCSGDKVCGCFSDSEARRYEICVVDFRM